MVAEDGPHCDTQNGEAFGETEAVPPFIVLAPEGGRRRRTDLRATCDGANDVDAEEGIAQVRCRVDVRPESRRLRARAKVATAERHDAVALREAKVPADAVGVQSGGVNHVPRTDRPGPV